MLNRARQTALNYNCASVSQLKPFSYGYTGISRAATQRNAPLLGHESGKCYSIMSRAKRVAGLQPTEGPQALKGNKEHKKSVNKSTKVLSHGIRKPVSPIERLVKVPDTFTQPNDPRLCKIALLGAANAGKSTLVNSLIGDNISVVSARAHTTRERILAVWTKDNHQIVFLDTPGVIYGRNQGKMNRTLVNASWQSLTEADHLLVVVDAAKAMSGRAYEAEDYIFERLKEFQIPATLILNKIDLVTDFQSLQDIGKELKTKYAHFDSVIYLSCFKDEDLQRLEVRELNTLRDDLSGTAMYANREYQIKLQTLTQSKDWVFPANQTSEMSDIQRVEDIIRAEFFQRLYGNLPYTLTQENVGWSEVAKGTLRIDQNIYVEHDSQQKIVKGSQGKVINNVLASAREQIEKALKRPVKLFLQIKTR